MNSCDYLFRLWLNWNFRIIVHIALGTDLAVFRLEFNHGSGKIYRRFFPFQKTIEYCKLINISTQLNPTHCLPYSKLRRLILKTNFFLPSMFHGRNHCSLVEKYFWCLCLKFCSKLFRNTHSSSSVVCCVWLQLCTLKKGKFLFFNTKLTIYIMWIILIFAIAIEILTNFLFLEIPMWQTNDLGKSTDIIFCFVFMCVKLSYTH